MVEFVVVTGLSGAGRTQVGNTLEDLGWFVIDNLPSELIPKVAELARFRTSSPAPVALIVGSDGGFEEVAPALDQLRSSGAQVRTVFLDAANATLVRRYGDTKRRHPLLADIGSLEGAIEEERRRHAPLRESAHTVAGPSGPHALDQLGSSGAQVRTVFLDAANARVVRRYGDTKRRHPLLADIGSLEGAIEEERRRLASVRESADIVIDTTDLNVHDLRRRVVEDFGDSGGRDSTQVTVRASGYKNGVPPDVDVVLDCRFLPHPHWVEELRPLTGLDAEVQDYVGSFELTDQFMERIEGLLELLLPAYVDEGKSVLTIAFGCTGGRHRSVSMAERLATWFRERGMEPRVRHRDVAK